MAFPKESRATMTELCATGGNPVRAIGVDTAARRLGARAAMVIGVIACGMALAPIGTAVADDDTLPGAPVIRGNGPGTVTAGPSEVRTAKSGAILGGVPSNLNGGGLIKDGNATSPGNVGNWVLCNEAQTGYWFKGHIDCGSDFIPYN